MKKAASVFSWLGGAITVISFFVYVLIVWGGNFVGLSVFYSLIVLFILYWREVSVENGKKVACGICTMIFASLIGGILTLAIPDSQFNKNQGKSIDSVTDMEQKPDQNIEIAKSDKPPKTNKYTEVNEKIDLIKKYKQMLDDGIITQEEFENKKKEIL